MPEKKTESFYVLSYHQIINNQEAQDTFTHKVYWTALGIKRGVESVLKKLFINSTEDLSIFAFFDQLFACRIPWPIISGNSKLQAECNIRNDSAIRELVEVDVATVTSLLGLCTTISKPLAWRHGCLHLGLLEPEMTILGWEGGAEEEQGVDLTGNP